MIPISAIYVLAGVNGSGKSSVGGVAIRAMLMNYFNPGEAAQKIIEENPGTTLHDANITAWNQGKRLLETAIAEHLDFAFETTLGGETITGLLEQAIEAGIEVHVWYVGLESPELCIERASPRVKAGGHPIPEAKIRQRYTQSRLNLIRLLPKLAKLNVYDNSAPGDPKEGKSPTPRPVLNMEHGRVVKSCDLQNVPEWAKPILVAVISLKKI